MAAVMTERWDDTQPIYQQLRDHTVARILAGELAEGEALPSVRQLAVELQINPITVSRAYQLLVDEQLVEKRRGLGMFVMHGAREQLLNSERDLFLMQELPKTLDRAQQLGISIAELLQHIKDSTE